MKKEAILLDKDKQFYYNLNFDSLKFYLRTDKDLCQILLKDTVIKDKIINCSMEYDFVWLVQDRNIDFTPLLLDDQGINLLEQSNDLTTKISGILTSRNPCVDKLFNSENFIKIVIDNLSKFKNFLYFISDFSANKMLEYIQDKSMNPEMMIEIVSNLGKIPQEQVIKSFTFPNSILERVLINANKNSSEYLLNNDLRITTLNNLSFSELFKIFSKDIQIPSVLLNEKKFQEKLVTITDPKDYRFLMNALESNNDISLIEAKRKQFYEREIRSYNTDRKMLDSFYQAYLELVNLIENQKISLETVEKIMRNHFNTFGDNFSWLSLVKNTMENCKDKNRLAKFFQEDSNYLLTNMIIDYHFEEIYYNFLLDVKQLYQFQKTEGRTLNDHDIEIYGKLLDLDNLSYSIKLSLFEELKQINTIEKYYDDFRNAKNRSFSMMKEQMLNFDNIVKYKNHKLSKEYGVDIYTLEGETFYAFVKSLYIEKNNVLTKDNIENCTVDGASYSLDGSDKLDTFENPCEYYNLLFGDFNINQIVHTYPVDSYSDFVRDGKATLGTDRVLELYTPRDFVRRSPDYNEIIYSQRSSIRNDELNEQLDVPKVLSIYCYDYITKNDIKSAKNLGIGITLVKTENYNASKSDDQIRICDTISYTWDADKGFNYLKYLSQDAMNGRRKVK